MKDNPWTYKVKELNGEKIGRSFYEKELLWSILRDNHIRDKVKAVLNLWNYTTKKELDHATGVGTSKVAAKEHLLL